MSYSLPVSTGFGPNLPPPKRLPPPPNLLSPYDIGNRERLVIPNIRGLKKVDTPILTGYQIYHNYIREHEALDGKTPAEALGIKIEDANKWITLIQNSVRAISEPSISGTKS
jgi:hypothetical protein